MISPNWMIGPGRVLALAWIAFSSLACGPEPAGGSPGAEATPVEQVGQLLRTCHEMGRPAPKSLKEAEKAPGASPQALAALKSGEVVIYWGVNLDEYGGASAIGYERGVPERGGKVILGDGSVVEMDAEQFRTIAKPPDAKLKPGGSR